MDGPSEQNKVVVAELVEVWLYNYVKGFYFSL